MWALEGTPSSEFDVCEYSQGPPSSHCRAKWLREAATVAMWVALAALGVLMIATCRKRERGERFPAETGRGGPGSATGGI